MASYATSIAQAENDNASAWYNILQQYTGTDSVEPQSEFHLFPLLPPELRLRIWEHALQEPATAHRTWNNDRFSYALRRRVPPVLQACRETRNWFIREPRLGEVPEGRYQLVHSRENQVGGVYLDWAKDGVYICRGCKFRFKEFEFAQLRKLRYLTMNWGLRPCWVESTLDEGVRFVRKFRELESLTLVVTMIGHGFSEKQLKRPLKVIACRVLRQFASESGRDEAWSPPKLRVLGTCGARSLRDLQEESQPAFL
ncbi:hypothetical protein GE09DRAFT_979545 [Coniochaeta sp. 2T2.1]|nr:hypothetical protein GE09DRAFT_979545 [Coniochaeta sp. 2T2.1]